MVMLSNRTIWLFKITVVASFTYSAYRLLLAPNQNKRIHLAVWIISSGIAALFTIFEKRKKCS